MKLTHLAVTFGLAILSIAHAAWGAPPAATVYRCWDPVTRTSETSQQRFAVCKGWQIKDEPGTVHPVSLDGPAEPVAQLATPQEGIAEEIRRLKLQMAQLADERPRMVAEAEFYVGKPLPARLGTAVENNETTMRALRLTLRAWVDDVRRIQAAQAR